jgi:LysR family transcriptional regulator, carnitine catabolism transcriptional activator
MLNDGRMIDYSSRQLRAFVLVAHHRSFARAAEALYITASGLSVLMRELETQFGFRLFDRTTRHVALTAQGAELLPIVRRNLADVDAAVSRLAQATSEATRSLSVGAPPLIAANILPQAIREFRAHRPDVRIQLVDANHLTIMRLVESGELDMGLGAFFGPAPTTRRTPLFRFSLMVIRPQTNDVSKRATVTWSALKGETVIGLPSSSPLQQLIEKHLARHGITERGPILNSLDTQIAMVEAGEGIAIIPAYGLPACRNRDVAVSRLINPVVTLDFSQVRARGRKLPPDAEDFTSFLQHHIARWAGRAGVL